MQKRSTKCQEQKCSPRENHLKLSCHSSEPHFPTSQQHLEGLSRTAGQSEARGKAYSFWKEKQGTRDRFIEAAGAKARKRNKGPQRRLRKPHTRLVMPEKRRLPHHSSPGMTTAATSTQKSPGYGWRESRSHSVHKMQCGKKQNAQQPKGKQSQRLAEKETQCVHTRDTEVTAWMILEGRHHEGKVRHKKVNVAWFYVKQLDRLGLGAQGQSGLHEALSEKAKTNKLKIKSQSDEMHRFAVKW